jgi:hypothetical protein
MSLLFEIKDAKTAPIFTSASWKQMGKKFPEIRKYFPKDTQLFPAVTAKENGHENG